MGLQTLETDVRAATASLRDARSFALGVVGLLAGAIGLGAPVLGLFRLVSPWPPRFESAVALEAVPALEWSLPWGARAVPAAAVQGEALADLLIVLAILAMVVVVVAAGGLVALLVERATARRQELAVHVAHGATRARLGRRLLLEAAALAGGGLVLGLAIAWPAAASIRRLIPDGMQLTAVAEGLPLSIPAIAALTALVLAGSLLPLIGAHRVGGGRVARSLAVRTDPAADRGLLPDFLLVGHVAVTLAVLAAAGLLARNAAPLNEPASLGFDPRDTLVIQLAFPEVAEGEADRAAAIEEVLAQLARLPGIRGASAAGAATWTGLGTVDQVVADCGGCFVGGLLLPFLAARPRIYAVGPGLFGTLGGSIRNGRELALVDGHGAERVVLVNASLASRFQGGDPIGRPLWVGDITQEPHTIVGVVDELRARGIGTGVAGVPAIYLPVLQHPPRAFELFVRTDGQARDRATAVLDTLTRAAPDLRIDSVQTLEARLAGFAAPLGWFARLFAGLAALALALGAYGVHGAVRYDVVQRTTEIGVRRAVGARRRDVVLLMLGEAARRGLIGGVLGLYATLALGRAIQLQFAEMRLLDPAVLVAAAFVIAASVLAASLPVALAAARQEPVRALGSEHS